MDTSPRPKNLDNRPVDRETRWADWAVDGLPVDIASSLTLARTHSQPAAQRVDQLADSLDAILDRYERAADAVDQWLASAEPWEDRLDRRAVLATLERLANKAWTPLPWPGWQPPAGTRRKRLMRELEMGLLRMHVALYGSRRVATMALLEAGATSGELVQVTSQHCDGPRVHLPGTARTQPRTITVLPWAEPGLADLVSCAPPGRSLLYTGEQSDPDKIESSILMNFRKPFLQAGLKNDPSLAPMSVRHTGLRALYDEHGWETCVAAAGTSSWDRLRGDIGLV